MLHDTYRRCTGARQCHKCQADPQVKPHGPYWELRRRNPSTMKQEVVYLGRIQPEPDKRLVEKRIGRLFTTDYLPQTGDGKRAMKEAILQLIADLSTM